MVRARAFWGRGVQSGQGSSLGGLLPTPQAETYGAGMPQGPAVSPFTLSPPRAGVMARHRAARCRWSPPHLREHHGGMQLLHTSERSDTTAAPAPAHAPRGKGTPVKGDAGDRGAAGTHNSTKGAAAVGSRWRGQEFCGGFRAHRGGPCPKLGTSSLLSEVPAASTAAFSATSLAPNDPSLRQNSGPRMEGARNA